jgi:uncharacterized repeat protein (TIGR01451 family)
MQKLLFFLGLLALSFSALSQIEIIYSVPGNYIWVVPNSVDSITVECWGAGGGGGNSANTQSNGGHGGGGGAYSRSVITNWAGDSSFIKVGLGGARGGTYSSGVSFQPTAGGQSYVSNALILTSNIENNVVASGGGSGLNNYTPQINNGGSLAQCIGQIINSGGNGKSANSNGGGGGGASGNIATIGQSSISQTGGIGQNGGGSGGNGASVGGTHGQAGTIPGGGGGGSDDWSQSAAGNGADGHIIVTLNNFFISGVVYNDANNNCIKDPGELGIPNVNIYLDELNYISNTDNNGIYYIPKLAIGNYNLSISVPNGWQNTCSSQINFNVLNPNEVLTLANSGIISLNPCSDPDVSIYAPFLRRCFSNQNVYVNACNQTTATGVLNASYVDVELDLLLTVNSATLPYTSQGNNVFRFQTGNLNPGQCVNFSISTTVSCSALGGQTLCMDATLYPIESCVLDTVPSDPITNDGTGGTVDGLPEPCTLPWDQSSLTVDGWCQNDSVYFYVENHGSGDMDCYLPVMVYVDGVLTQTDSIQLVSGQGITYVFPAYGETWILNAEQHPLHPGNSHPNAHVEACGDTINFSRDFVNEFPQDDADPVVDIYCGVVTGSYDPNDKTGYPIGQTAQKYIQPNQQLQYVIRFQNTGTDTAFTVVIRDTLDLDLNIFTVTAGVSSHPYTFRMYGPRVLEWTFNNILLPDSTTNSDGSNGFVTFHVEQVPNLAPGTEITNDADIYFDFNDPITTNTTMHRIYEGFVSVLNIEDLTQEGKSLLVYPNPTSHSITIKGEKNLNQSFQIFDQMGREVFKGKLTGTETEVNLSALSKGMYTLKIEGNYQPAQIVKE